MRSMLRGNSGGSDRMCPSWEESGGWTGTGGGSHDPVRDSSQVQSWAADSAQSSADDRGSGLAGKEVFVPVSSDV